VPKKRIGLMKASSQVNDVGYDPEDSQDQTDVDGVPEKWIAPIKASLQVDDVEHEPK
jgi:hypothetical protein